MWFRIRQGAILNVLYWFLSFGRCRNEFGKMFAFGVLCFWKMDGFYIYSHLMCNFRETAFQFYTIKNNSNGSKCQNRQTIRRRV